MHASNAKVIFQALIDIAPQYAAKYNMPVSKINDQEMASDFYMQGRFDIKLDHTNRIFQAMHATHAKPLVECDPWPEMVIDEGRWENKAFETKPKILHFNGGAFSLSPSLSLNILLFLSKQILLLSLSLLYIHLY
jgi:hypothetical protein